MADSLLLEKVPAIFQEVNAQEPKVIFVAYVC